MAIAVETVEVPVSNLIANNVVSGVPMPLSTSSELAVYYGSSRALAVPGTDYSVVIATDGQTFSFTPTASLLTKIGLLGMGNVAYLKRVLNYKSDLTEGDTFFRAKIVQAVDRIMMRFQQISAYLKTGANRNITVSTAAPSGGDDGDIWIKVP